MLHTGATSMTLQAWNPEPVHACSGTYTVSAFFVIPSLWVYFPSQFSAVL